MGSDNYSYTACIDYYVHFYLTQKQFKEYNLGISLVVTYISTVHDYSIYPQQLGLLAKASTWYKEEDVRGTTVKR